MAAAVSTEFLTLKASSGQTEGEARMKEREEGRQSETQWETEANVIREQGSHVGSLVQLLTNLPHFKRLNMQRHFKPPSLCLYRPFSLSFSRYLCSLSFSLSLWINSNNEI